MPPLSNVVTARPGTPWCPGAAIPPAALTPDPEAEPGSFRAPFKAIATPADVQAWVRCETYRDLVGFVTEMQRACLGTTLPDNAEDAPSMSPVCTAAMAMLDTMEGWVEEIPAIQQGMRYGNTAFKDWHARLVQEAPALLEAVLPPPLLPAAVELGPYLQASFGDPQRIDYGTGHETCFVAWMLAMMRVEALSASDVSALALRLFPRYLRVMRKLQLTYRLEPAGSHGVWGLDDYQFLPFLIGAAQLVGREAHGLTPEVVVNDPRVKEEGPESLGERYLYIEGIRFICSVKRGPFFEHSPLLHDISNSVTTWTKVGSGMLKMYEAEVLQKFPVIQHFLFGSLLPPP